MPTSSTETSADGKECPNACIIAMPEGREWDAVTEAVGEAADRCNGTPVPVPHCTVQYLYGVDAAGVKALQAELPRIVRDIRPFPIEVTGILTDWGAYGDVPQDMLVMAVRKTEALCAVYTHLSDLAWAVGLDPSPFASSEWSPHIKVLKDYSCRPEDVVDKVLPLISRLSFTARSLYVSAREGDGRWINQERVMLARGVPGRLWGRLRSRVFEGGRPG